MPGSSTSRLGRDRLAVTAVWQRRTGRPATGMDSCTAAIYKKRATKRRYRSHKGLASSAIAENLTCYDTGRQILYNNKLIVMQVGAI